MATPDVCPKHSIILPSAQGSSSHAESEKSTHQQRLHSLFVPPSHFPEPKNSLCDHQTFEIRNRHYFFSIIPRILHFFNKEEPNYIRPPINCVKYLKGNQFPSHELVKGEMTVELFYDYLTDEARVWASAHLGKQEYTFEQFQGLLSRYHFHFDPPLQEQLFLAFKDLILLSVVELLNIRNDDYEKRTKFKNHFSDPSNFPAMPEGSRVEKLARSLLLEFDIKDEMSWAAKSLAKNDSSNMFNLAVQMLENIDDEERKLLQRLCGACALWDRVESGPSSEKTISEERSGLFNFDTEEAASSNVEGADHLSAAVHTEEEIDCRLDFSHVYTKEFNEETTARTFLSQRIGEIDGAEKAITACIDENMVPIVALLAETYENHTFSRFGDLPRLYRNFLNRLELIASQFSGCEQQRTFVYNLVIKIIENSWSLDQSTCSTDSSYRTYQGNAGCNLYDDDLKKLIIGTLHQVKLSDPPAETAQADEVINSNQGFSSNPLENQFRNEFARAHTLPFPRMFSWVDSYFIRDQLNEKELALPIPKEWKDKKIVWNGSDFEIANPGKLPSSKRFELSLYVNSSIFMRGRGYAESEGNTGKLNTGYMNKHFASQIQSMKEAAGGQAESKAKYLIDGVEFTGSDIKFLIGALTLLHRLTTYEFSETHFLPKIMNDTIDSISESEKCFMILSQAMKNLLEMNREQPRKMCTATVIQNLEPYALAVHRKWEAKEGKFQRLGAFESRLHRLMAAMVLSAIDTLFDRHCSSSY